MKPLFLLLALACTSMASYTGTYTREKELLPQSAWIAAHAGFDIGILSGFEPQKIVAITDLVDGPEHVLAYFNDTENIRLAVAAAKQIGCPPSIVLAHDAIESGWAKSLLFKKTLNSGNIKCSCNGKSKRAQQIRIVHQRLADAGHPVCVKAHDKIEGSNHYYRIMPDAATAWAEKVKILAGYYHIKKAAKSNSGYRAWAQAFENSPYSSDTECAEKIMAVLNLFDLRAIDNAIDSGYCITTKDRAHCLWLPI